MNAPHDKPIDADDATNSPSFVDTAPSLRPELGDCSRRGLLVVGHGTRDPAGIAEFHETMRLIESHAARLPHGPRRVEGCFLELAEPTIDAAIDRLAASGVDHLTVAPLILFAAGHAKRDIPEAVAAAAGRVGINRVQQMSHLGCRPEMVALSARRFQEAVSRLEPVVAAQTLLLMVGRGSRDEEATAEMHRFAQLRAAATPVGRLEVAFTAMAEPNLDQAIERVARLPLRRIVVQPHLLFAGELLERVQATVRRAAETWPDRQWVVAGHLGAEPEIAAAVVGSLTGL